MKYFNVLIDGKNVFDLPVKNEEETYEKNIDLNSIKNINFYKILSQSYK